MKSLKYALLLIGLAGILAGIYGFISGSDFTTNLMGLICGSCLVFGYYELQKKNVAKVSE